MIPQRNLSLVANEIVTTGGHRVPEAKLAFRSRGEEGLAEEANLRRRFPVSSC